MLAWNIYGSPGTCLEGRKAGIVGRVTAGTWFGKSTGIGKCLQFGYDFWLGRGAGQVAHSFMGYIWLVSRVLGGE